MFREIPEYSRFSRFVAILYDDDDDDDDKMVTVTVMTMNMMNMMTTITMMFPAVVPTQTSSVRPQLQRLFCLEAKLSVCTWAHWQ